MDLSVSEVKNFHWCPKYYEWAHVNKTPIPIALSTYSRKLLKKIILSHFHGKIMGRDVYHHDMNTSWAEHFYKDPADCKYSITDSTTDQYSLGLSYINIFYNKFSKRGITGKILKAEEETYINIGEDIFGGTIDVIRDVQLGRESSNKSRRVREIFYIDPFKVKGPHSDLELLAQAYLYIKKFNVYGVHMTKYDLVTGKMERFFKSKEELQVFEDIVKYAFENIKRKNFPRVLDIHRGGKCTRCPFKEPCLSPFS